MAGFDEKIFLQYIVSMQDTASAALSGDEAALKKLGDTFNKMGGAASMASGAFLKAKDGAKGLGQDLRGVGNEADVAKSKSMQLVATLGDVQSIIESTTGSIINYVKEATYFAANTEMMGTALRVAGTNAGYSNQELLKAESGIKKLGIATSETRQIMTLFIQSQLKVSEAAKLARAAQDLAVSAQMSSSQAAQTLTYAISAQSVMMLRQFGLVTSSQELWDKYALKIGKASSALDENERKQAFLSGVLDFAAKNAGTYEAAMEDVGKQLTSMKRYTEEAMNTIGSGFIPILEIVVKKQTEWYKSIINMTTGQKSLMTGVVTFVGALAALAGAIATVVTAMAGWQMLIATMGPAFVGMLGPVAMVAAAISALLGAYIAYQSYVGSGSKQDKIIAKFKEQETTVISLQKKLEGLKDTAKDAAGETLKTLQEVEDAIRSTGKGGLGLGAMTPDFKNAYEAQVFLTEKLKTIRKQELAVQIEKYDVQLKSLDLTEKELELIKQGKDIQKDAINEANKKLFAATDKIIGANPFFNVVGVKQDIADITGLMETGMAAVQTWQQAYDASRRRDWQAFVQGMKSDVPAIRDAWTAAAKATGQQHLIAKEINKEREKAVAQQKIEQDFEALKTKHLKEQADLQEWLASFSQKNIVNIQGLQTSLDPMLKQMEALLRDPQMQGQGLKNALGIAANGLKEVLQYAQRNNVELDKLPQTMKNTIWRIASMMKDLGLAFKEGLPDANNIKALMAPLLVFLSAWETGTRQISAYESAYKSLTEGFKESYTGLQSAQKQWELVNKAMTNSGVKFGETGEKARFWIKQMKQVQEIPGLKPEFWQQIQDWMLKYNDAQLKIARGSNEWKMQIADVVQQASKQTAGTQALTNETHLYADAITAMERTLGQAVKTTSTYLDFKQKEVLSLIASGKAYDQNTLALQKNINAINFRKELQQKIFQVKTEEGSDQMLSDLMKEFKDAGMSLSSNQQGIENFADQIQRIIDTATKDGKVAANVIYQLKLILESFTETGNAGQAAQRIANRLLSREEVERIKKDLNEIRRQITEGVVGEYRLRLEFILKLRQLNEQENQDRIDAEANRLRNELMLEEDVVQERLTLLKDQIRLEEILQKQKLVKQLAYELQVPIKVVQAWMIAYANIGQMSGEAQEAALKKLEADIKKYLGGIVIARDKFEDINRAAQELYHTQQKINQTTMSFIDMLGSLGFGKMAEDMSRMAQGANLTAQGVIGMGEAWSKMNTAGASSVEKMDAMLDLATNLFQTISGIAQQWQSIKESGSIVARAMGGAQLGAQIGGMIGKMIPFVGEFAGKIGGAIIGGLIGAFNKPAWKDTQNRVAKEFGAKISDELAKSIAELAKKEYKGNRQAAEIASLSKIMSEAKLSAQNFSRMLGKLHDTFSLLQTGAFTSAQAMDVLNENFSTFAEYVAKQGKDVAKEMKGITDAMFDMVKKGKLTTQEVASFLDQNFTALANSVEKQRGLASDALLDLIKKTQEFKVVSTEVQNFLKAQADAIGESMSAVALGFAGNINKKFAELKTLTNETLPSMTESMEAIKKEMNEIANGDGGEEDTKRYKELQKELEKLTEESEKAVKTAGRLRQELTGFSGDLQENFNRQGRLMRASMEAMIADGASYSDVIKQLGPGLDELIKMQQELGVTADENFQTMLKTREWVTQNEELADSMSALDKLTKSLYNSNRMTAATFKDLGAEAVRQYKAAQTTGLTQEESAKMMAGSLQTLYDLQQKYGFEVDEATQALLDQAKAQGIVSDAQRPWMDKLVDGVKRVGDILARVFGDTLPDEAKDGANKTTAQTDRVVGGVDGITKALEISKDQWRVYAKTAVASLDEIYDAQKGVIYGHSPGGLTDIIDKSGKVIDAYTNVAKAGVSAMKDVYEAQKETAADMKKFLDMLADMDEQILQETLEGIALTMHNLEKARTDALKQWMEDAKDATKQIQEDGVKKINELYDIKERKAKAEDAKAKADEEKRKRDEAASKANSQLVPLEISTGNIDYMKNRRGINLPSWGTDGAGGFLNAPPVMVNISTIDSQGVEQVVNERLLPEIERSLQQNVFGVRSRVRSLLK